MTAIDQTVQAGEAFIQKWALPGSEESMQDDLAELLDAQTQMVTEARR